MKNIRVFLLLPFLLSLALSCSKLSQNLDQPNAASTPEAALSQPEPSPNKEANMANTNWQEPKSAQVDPSKKYLAQIETSKGTIVCQLNAKAAPLSVTNFKYLADGKFYDGLTFHRVVPGFVIQGGDPTGTGAGGPGYTIPAEIGLKHEKNAIAWARTGDEVNPERRSSGSQFYITHVPVPFLDGQYSVFGNCVEGSQVIDNIRQGDQILSVRVSVSDN